MLTEDQIAKALHASRVVALPSLNPHGPLGLEQLSEVITELSSKGRERGERVRRPIELSVDTWAKLDQLARGATPANARPLTASALAAALLERAVTSK
jgi:hypothetical protein